MAIYNLEEWLEKCELDAIVDSLLMPVTKPMEGLRRNLSLDNCIGFMKNKLFIDGIYEEITPRDVRKKTHKTREDNNAQWEKFDRCQEP